MEKKEMKKEIDENEHVKYTKDGVTLLVRRGEVARGRIDVIKVINPRPDEGNYAVIQRTPYLAGTTYDFFDTLEECKAFLRDEVLPHPSTKRWAANIEEIREFVNS